jgi:hypothetical protein
MEIPIDKGIVRGIIKKGIEPFSLLSVSVWWPSVISVVTILSEYLYHLVFLGRIESKEISQEVEIIEDLKVEIGVRVVDLSVERSSSVA